MYNWIFVGTMALFLAPVIIWSFKALPRDRWQIFCAIPVNKKSNGSWQGLNLTYHGLFNGMALSATVALVLILTGAARINFSILATLIVILLVVCWPSSRWMVRWGEKKPHNFSAGAALFAGIVLGPWLILLMAIAAEKLLKAPFEPMAVLSALMVAYSLGEGIGRLTCISLGCCYGKPIEQMPRVVQHYFSWATFTYSGRTEKIAYDHRLEGKKVFAVQAVTAILHIASALTGTLLYLNGEYAWAFFLCLVLTQGWRYLSEFLRYDYRGEQEISNSQIMSLLSIIYTPLILFVFPSSGSGVNVLAGLRAFWNPSTILFLLLLWIIILLQTGRSQITGSGLCSHVYQDQK